MNEPSTKVLSFVIEREIPYPPEKIWRALTQPHLIEEWLMKNDFKPVVGHRFNLRADWGAVDCQVLTIEPNKTLWLSVGSAAVLRGRKGWMAGVLCGPGAGLGADRLKSAGAIQR